MSKEQVSEKWSTIRSDMDSNNLMKYTPPPPRNFTKILAAKKSTILHVLSTVYIFFSTAIDGIIEVPLPLSNVNEYFHLSS